MLSECQTAWILVRYRVTRRLIQIKDVCIWNYSCVCRAKDLVGVREWYGRLVKRFLRKTSICLGKYADSLSMCVPEVSGTQCYLFRLQQRS